MISKFYSNRYETNEMEHFGYFSMKQQNGTFIFSRFRNIPNGSYFVWKILGNNLALIGGEQEFKFLKIHQSFYQYWISL
ncbi:hypothetical protein MXB_4334 [Myxobolus squamalis]|nr:hypothetical protein MXB_4334 [Myxobolus squamalis]